MTTRVFLRCIGMESSAINIKYVYFGVTYIQGNITDDLISKLNAENSFFGIKIADLLENDNIDYEITQLLDLPISCFSIDQEGQVFVQAD